MESFVDCECCLSKIWLIYIGIVIFSILVSIFIVSNKFAVILLIFVTD